MRVPFEKRVATTTHQNRKKIIRLSKNYVNEDLGFISRMRVRYRQQNVLNQLENRLIVEKFWKYKVFS